MIIRYQLNQTILINVLSGGITVRLTGSIAMLKLSTDILVWFNPNLIQLALLTHGGTAKTVII